HFSAARCGDVISVYKRAQEFACKRVNPAPLVILGEEVFLDRSRFVRQPGAIHVLSDRALTPVNFAACWNDGPGPQNFIDVETKVSALLPLVPPILFTEIDGCYHLRFDFFRNSWMVSDRKCMVPVPRVSEGDPDWEEMEAPWLDAIDRASLTPED